MKRKFKLEHVEIQEIREDLLGRQQSCRMQSKTINQQRSQPCFLLYLQIWFSRTHFLFYQEIAYRDQTNCKGSKNIGERHTCRALFMLPFLKINLFIFKKGIIRPMPKKLSMQ